jgi:hypothetical protein
MSGRTIAVILAFSQITRGMILELFFEREGIEFPPKSKLAVNFLLGDVEVLDIEEAWPYG